MKLKFIMAVCLTCASLQQSSAHVTGIDTVYADALKPLGRFAMHKGKGLELISSAVHFEVSFNGRIVKLYATIPDVNGHNYIQYALDGIYQKRILISGTSTEPITIDAKTNSKHVLTIYKATEAHTGPIFISKIAATGIKAVERSQAPIIEFIGNSITCGAAADASETPCQTGAYHDQHNAYMAYGPRLGRALGAQFVLSSVSGIGVYRTWNRTGPAMPEVYDKIDFQNRTERKWDFSNFQPAVISIALGTNDLSGGDGKTPRLPFDSVTFVNQYVQFIKSLKIKHPTSKIALLSSPMIKGSQRDLLQRALLAIKHKIEVDYPDANKVSVFFFEPMDARGCNGHPSVEDHAILASQLKPFFKDLLKK